MLKKTVFISLIAFMSGCASMDHVYNADGACLTCFNNPLTGEPMNHDGQPNDVSKPVEVAATQTTTSTNNTQAKSVSYEKQQVKFNADVNVDVAFIALKEEFRFLSEQEVRKERGSYAEFKLRANDYHWKAMPGVSYTLGEEREILGSWMNLQMIINKRTDSSSTIIVNFWPRDESVDSDAVGQHLLGRVKTALNN